MARRTNQRRSYPQHGKRSQEISIDFIEEYLFWNPTAKTEHALVSTSQLYHIPITTLRRWYKHYIFWGEYPHVTVKKLRAFKKKYKEYTRTSGVMTDEIINGVRNIVEESPELYLDEIMEKLAQDIGVYLPHMAVYRILTDKLRTSLQVCTEVATQRNKEERRQYRHALDLLVQHPNQVLVLDETHKDRNASRRRRGWGERNGDGVKIRRWFRMNLNYTMIAAMNINGFIGSTIKLIMRDEISDEGAAGTVNGEGFQEWVREYLLPVLGSYANNEDNSIVIMDNASTHMSREVVRMIEGTGAYLLYSAPYSPDLSPIEYLFSVYKSNLKRFSRYYEKEEWYELHLHAIREIDEDVSLMQFRHCGIPKSNEILTEDEVVECFLQLLLN